MKIVTNQVFSKTDAVLEEGLNQRLAKQMVISGNIVNANTPGFRALGYEFESQLQAAVGNDSSLKLETTDPEHIMHSGLNKAGDLKPDLIVKPTESVGNDGNTVDVDQEMSDLAANKILYQATVELLNRRLAMLRYGINGGR